MIKGPPRVANHVTPIPHIGIRQINGFLEVPNFQTIDTRARRMLQNFASGKTHLRLQDRSACTGSLQVEVRRRRLTHITSGLQYDQISITASNHVNHQESKMIFLLSGTRHRDGICISILESTLSPSMLQCGSRHARNCRILGNSARRRKSRNKQVIPWIRSRWRGRRRGRRHDAEISSHVNYSMYNGR